MKYLFIGNSHTYYNSMPHLFEQLAAAVDPAPHVVMLAHGGMGYPFHADGEEAPFNIRYGHYDYVILQHVAHPMGDIDEMFRAGRLLAGMAKEYGAKPLLYMTWTKKGDEAAQADMSDAYRRLARETGSLLAPVGDVWQETRRQLPHLELYFTDDRHASYEGSHLAASTIFSAIFRQPAPADSADRRQIAQLAWAFVQKENP